MLRVKHCRRRARGENERKQKKNKRRESTIVGGGGRGGFLVEWTSGAPASSCGETHAPPPMIRLLKATRNLFTPLINCTTSSRKTFINFAQTLVLLGVCWMSQLEEIREYGLMRNNTHVSIRALLHHVYVFLSFKRPTYCTRYTYIHVSISVCDTW